MAVKSVCTIDGCGKRVHARGWCWAHYERWRSYGDPLGGRPTFQGHPKRFFLDTVLTFAGEDCLTWPYGGKGPGYAGLRIGKKTVSVHRLVCEMVHGPAPTPEHEAAHSCGKGHEGCVNPRHIRWATRVENKADMLIHGTRQMGSSHPKAKLTEADVKEIRSLRGSVRGVDLARRYGVNKTTIHKIQYGLTWKHAA